MELARRIGRDLADAHRVWLDDALDDAFGAALPQRVRRVGEPATADIAVVAADTLGGDGSVLASAANLSRAPRVLAVLVGDGDVIFVKPHASDRKRVRAARAYSQLAVVDVRRDGLVIVELAKGVSAADLQQRSEPTLLISPDLAEMVVADDDAEP